MIMIQGLTQLQRDIADQLWALDTTQQVHEYMETLPASLRPKAWAVQQMIIAHELDSYMEVSNELKDYLAHR